MANEIQHKRHAQVTVSGGVTGLWDKKNAAAKKSPVRRYYPGGSTKPVILTDPAEIDTLTISRGFVYSRDQPLLKRMLAEVDSNPRYVIEERPTDPAMRARGDKITYTGLLTGATTVEVDSNSGDAQEIVLTFDIEEVK